MYTIKKFRHNEVIKSVKIDSGTAGIKSKGVMWVVMLDNEPVFASNRMTGKSELVAYSRKYIAQKEADYFNQKGDTKGYIGTNC